MSRDAVLVGASLALEEVVPRLVREVREELEREELGNVDLVQFNFLDFKTYCHYNYGVADNDQLDEAYGTYASFIDRFSLSQIPGLLGKWIEQICQLSKEVNSPELKSRLQAIHDEAKQRVKNQELRKLAELMGVIKDWSTLEEQQRKSFLQHLQNYDHVLKVLFRHLPQPRHTLLAGIFDRPYDRVRPQEAASQQSQEWQWRDLDDTHGIYQGLIIRNWRAFEQWAVEEGLYTDACEGVDGYLLAWRALFECVLTTPLSLVAEPQDVPDVSILVVPFYHYGCFRGLLYGYFRKTKNLEAAYERITSLSLTRLGPSLQRAFEHALLTKLIESRADTRDDWLKAFAQNICLIQDVGLVSLWVATNGNEPRSLGAFPNLPEDLAPLRASLANEPWLRENEKRFIQAHGQVAEISLEFFQHVDEQLFNICTALRGVSGSRLFLPVPLGEQELAWFVLYYPDAPQEQLKQKYFGKYIIPRINQISAFIPLIKEQQERIEELLKSNAKAAIAAIMGRVLAHDWSHLLVHAKLPVDYREPWFDHLKGYLRERMVFIADVTTSQPTWTLSLPFLAGILRPFTHLGESIPSPHRTAVSCHIAESEGVTAVNIQCALRGDALVSIYHREGQELQELRYEWDKTNSMWLACSSGYQGSKSPEMKLYDMYVSIPSGVVGIHAVYCFLENFVRNSAKYSAPPTKPQTLNLRVRLDEEGEEGEEGFDGLFRVRIWDDRSVYAENSFRFICRFFPPYCLSGLEDFQSPGDDWRIIDTSGRLIPGGWGIKEMRIATAWLRQYSPVEALLSEGETEAVGGKGLGQRPHPPVLRPIIVTQAGDRPENASIGQAYMGYEFYLLKPQEALIIGDLELEQNRIQALRREGVELENDLVGIEIPRRHHICVVSMPDQLERSNQWLSLLRDHRENLPAISMVVSDDPLTLNLPPGVCPIDSATYKPIVQYLTTESQTCKASLLKAYKDWIRYVIDAPDELTLVLHMNPQSVECTPATVFEYWKKTAEDFNQLFKPWQLYITQTGVLGSQEYQVKLTPVPDPSFFSTCPQNLLIYDYHHVFSDWSPWSSRNSFVEKFSGTDPTHTILYNPPQNKWARLKMAVELVAAAVANLAIVDERIWRRFLQSSTLQEKLAETKVAVPVDFNYATPGEHDSEKLLTMLQDQKIRILVIHQGILEKMFNHRQGEVKQAIETWIESVKGAAQVQFVIVISDRGIPENLPDNARYADYAVVDKFVSATHYSKYYVTHAMLATRRAMRMEGNRNGTKTNRGVDSKLA
jgi:hypothetical protein